MEITLTKFAKRRIRNLHKRHRDLDKILSETLELYLMNPRDSRLKLHKLERKDKAWSISLKDDLRLIFVYWQKGIVIIDIGSHDEVY